MQSEVDGSFPAFCTNDTNQDIFVFSVSVLSGCGSVVTCFVRFTHTGKLALQPNPLVRAHRLLNLFRQT